jgi:hypothetical protein
MSAKLPDVGPKKSLSTEFLEAHGAAPSPETPRVLLVSNVRMMVSGVTPVSWDGPIPNPADFDVVILDLVTLWDKTQKAKQLPKAIAVLTQNAIANLLWSSGRVVCVVPPIEDFEPWNVKGYDSPFWWSPIPLTNVLESGQTRTIHDPRLRRYFEKGVSKWRSYAVPRAASTKNAMVHFNVDALVSARYKVPIAASATMQSVVDILTNISRPGQTPRSGPIIVLPEPDLIPIGEALQIILQDLVGFALETPPPPWVSMHSYPGEDKVREEIENLENQKNRVEAKIMEARGRLRDLDKHKRLLFENGPELEQAVWDALEALGAVVHPSEISGREDRWFEVPGLGLKAAMEIKGHMNGMSTKDARQTDDWASDILERKGEQMKAILFGNPFRGKPPGTRGDPWPPDVVRYAATKHVALVTTSQLYEVLVKVRKGEANPMGFFKALFSSDGPVQS